MEIIEIINIIIVLKIYYFINLEIFQGLKPNNIQLLMLQTWVGYRLNVIHHLEGLQQVEHLRKVGYMQAAINRKCREFVN